MKKGIERNLDVATEIATSEKLPAQATASSSSSFQWSEENFPSWITQAFGGFDNIMKLPQLDLKGRMGVTDYIDFLQPKDMNGHRVMRGVDGYKRPFIALSILCNTTKKLNVCTFFQRYTNEKEPWVWGGNSFYDCPFNRPLRAETEGEMLSKLIKSEKIVTKSWSQKENEYQLDIEAHPETALAASTPTVTTPTVTTPTVATPAVTTPTVTTPAVTTPTVTTPAVTTPAVTTPAVTTPAVTTPAVTTPAVTTPAVTKPAVTKPAVTTPAVTTPAVTTPAVTTPAVSEVLKATPAVVFSLKKKIETETEQLQAPVVAGTKDVSSASEYHLRKRIKP